MEPNINGVPAVIAAALAELGTGIGAFQARLDAIESRIGRPGPGPANPDATAASAAFRAWARTGVISGPIQAALTTDAGSGGSIVAPATLLQEIEKNLVLFNRLRTVARVTTMSTGSVKLPKRTAGPTGARVTETGARSGSESVYDDQDFPAYEYGAYSDVSNVMLEDSAFNIEAELAADWGEEMGRLEAADFWSGTGSGQPGPGIMSANITPVQSDGANAITADDVIRLFYQLPTAFAANSTFAMTRETLGLIRALRDSNGNFLCSSSLQVGSPELVLGRQVVEVPEADPVVETGSPSTTFPIVVGDFRYLRVFDRVGPGVQILRDPYSLATTGKTRFHVRKRTASGVSKAEAFRILQVG